MEQSDITRQKEQFLDYLQNDVKQSVIYKGVHGSSVQDPRFAFFTTEVNTTNTLWASVMVNPSDKVKRTYGVSNEAVLMVLLATKQLEDLAVTLQREAGIISYEGVEYEIDRIDPKPRVFGTSVMTVVSCVRRKPVTS